MTSMVMSGSKIGKEHERLREIYPLINNLSFMFMKVIALLSYGKQNTCRAFVNLHTKIQMKDTL